MGGILKTKQEKLFISKLIFTIYILVIYAIMRDVHLYGVDYAKMSESSIDAEMVLSQMVGGDIYKCSIVAVGLAPYMISSIIVMVLQLFKSDEAKARTSLKSINKFTIFITLVLTIAMASVRCNNLEFLYTGSMGVLARFVAILEMVTGSLLVIWLSARNKRYGIGGQMAPITINVLDGIMATVSKCDRSILVRPVLLGVAMMIVMLWMENTEKRIPVQRLSIHNIYADKNYQAIKFNPVGIMPVIFASAAFMLPQLIVQALAMNMPESEKIMWVSNNMVLGKPLGIVTYIVVLYILNIIFAVIMINPKDISEGFQKSGDSVVNLRPGKETRRYFRRNILAISLLSSTVIGVCLGGSMVLQMVGYFDGSVAMLPSSLMLISGLFITLYKEAEAIINTDSYKLLI